jgi:hypothetical protein
VSCDDGLCASLANMLLICDAFPVLQAPNIGFFDGINGPGEPTNPPGRPIQQAVDGERFVLELAMFVLPLK